MQNIHTMYMYAYNKGKTNHDYTNNIDTIYSACTVSICTVQTALEDSPNAYCFILCFTYGLYKTKDKNKPSVQSISQFATAIGRRCRSVGFVGGTTAGKC